MPNLIGKDELAQAVRNNDAISEEHQDQRGFWRERGVDVEGLMEVAMQRGMRVVMIKKGMRPNPSRPLAVAFTQAEQAQITQFAGSFLDGFAAALEVNRQRGRRKL